MVTGINIWLDIHVDSDTEIEDLTMEMSKAVSEQVSQYFYHDIAVAHKRMDVVPEQALEWFLEISLHTIGCRRMFLKSLNMHVKNNYRSTICTSVFCFIFFSPGIWCD